MAIKQKNIVLAAHALVWKDSYEVEITTTSDYITLSIKEAKKFIKELQEALVKLNIAAAKDGKNKDA